MRTYVWMVGRQVQPVFHRNTYWMGWNLLLAVVPAVLATLLFHRARRRTALWWCGVVAFVLFLPNAPYVLTDLVHLRADVRSVSMDGAVVFGILPLYALFVAGGFACYGLALYEVDRAMERSPWPHRRGVVRVGLHAACAVGVLLGRVPHINSWSVITQPHIALGALRTFTHPAALLLVGVLFVAISLGHASMQLAVEAAWRSAGRLRARPAGSGVSL